MTRKAWILLGILALVAIGAPILRGRGHLEIGPGDPDGDPDRDPDGVLRSLPYLTWVAADETRDLRGVTLHQPELSAAGLNLYSPRESHRAFLLDMSGEVLHRWDVALEKDDSWQLVEPLDDGSLLVVNANRRLLRIDRDSNIVWRLDHRVHHDVAVADTGEIFTLGRDEREVVHDGRSLPVLDDLILKLSPQGEILERLSLLDLFRDRVPEQRWTLLAKWAASEAGQRQMAETSEGFGFSLPNGSPADLFHTNSIEILERDIPGVAGAGTLLISIRELSLVAIVDFDARRVDWTWGSGVVRRQHHPSQLANGNILIYDNLGGDEGLSRIVELDPQTREVVWQYNGDPPDAFFSALRGGCQRLSNGNTLITESDRGRVFEIRPDGEVVWEFYNPVTRDGGSERSSIYRMMRLEPEAAAWLETGP